MSFTILSLIFSSLLQIVLAYLYGTKKEMDVYFLSLSIPLFVSGIVLSTIAVVLIPIFREFIVKSKEEGLRDFIDTAVSYLLLALSVITLFLFFSSPLIISNLAKGLSIESKELAISLLRILSFSIIPAGLYSLFVVIYYSQESFLKPVFVRSLGPLIIILITILFNRFLGIKSVAYGFVFGAVIQFFIMLYYLKKESKKFKFSFKLSIDTKIDKLWRMIFFVMASIFIFGLILPIEKFLAASLSDGSVSYLGYVERTFSILILLPNMAIPTVILPQLAGHYAIKDIAKLRSTFSSSIRSTLFITFPLVVFLFIFKEPLIYVFLQRGAFGKQATINTALGLACYLGVFFESERLVILNTLYAIRDTLTPFIVGFISVVFYILMALLLSAKMSFFGLALAHSAACLVYSAINLIVLRKKLRFIDGTRICFSAAKIAISSIAAGVVMWFVFSFLSKGVYSNYAFLIFLKLAISALIGAVSYGGFCFLLRLQELSQFYSIVISYKRQLLLRNKKLVGI